MSVNPNPLTINLSIGSNFFKNYPVESSKLLEIIPENTFSFLLIENNDIFQQLNPENHLKVIPIYSILRGNPISPEHPDLVQIDSSGSAIPTYICPNNPKLEHLAKRVFETLNKSSQIAGIQLNGLEMPPLSHYLSCFCSYCTSLADTNGIDLNEISSKLKERAKKGLNEHWIYKKFPKWIKFRTESIYNLAGKLMILIRKINPDLLIGLNVNFSENAKTIEQNYFFLALFLDMLNFVVNVPSNKVGKKLLRQIRSVTKKFLGNIQLFIQLNVPNEFNLNQIKTNIVNVEKYSFNGLIFHISALNELEKIYKIRFTG
ncbi:MAG: hypothetical protein ACFFD2_03870 [Promethearchaeota archaeon]